LQAVAKQRLSRQPAWHDHRLELHALDVLHDDARLVVDFGDLVDGADVGVIQGRGCACLLQQPSAVLVVVSALQELDGHAAPQHRVVGSIDDAHAAGSELRLDLVVAE
jgi:hypothetical protein